MLPIRTGGDGVAGAAAAEPRRRSALRKQVADAVERVLGAPVDHDVVLMAAGLDSLGLIELVAELEKFAKIDLPAEQLLLTHPSVSALVGYLESRTSAAEMRVFTVLGWCIATLSWLAGGAGQLSRVCAAVALVASSSWLALRASRRAAGDAGGPLTLALLLEHAALLRWQELAPVAGFVALTVWPSVFFLASSLAFVVGGSAPQRLVAKVHATVMPSSPKAPWRGASGGGGGADSPRLWPRSPRVALQQQQDTSPGGATRQASSQLGKGAAQPLSPPRGGDSAVAARREEPLAVAAPAAELSRAGSSNGSLGGAAEGSGVHQRELQRLREGLEGAIEVCDLERGRTVGLGTYGKVLLVRHAATGTPFALKCLDRRLVVANAQQRAVARERTLMATVAHPFCCRLVRSFKDATAVYLLLEWCPGGELMRVLPQDKGLPQASVRFYVGCAALALEHLHAQGIVYRDLKPENLLLDGAGYVKLCDFGFAKRLGAAGVTHTMCGTPDYMAPEVVRGRGHGRAADLWSLGVLLYELATGRPPFAPRGAAPATVYAAVLAGVVQPLQLAQEGGEEGGDGAELRALVAALLQLEPAERLGAGAGGWGELRAHAWFRGAGFTWEELERRELPVPSVPVLSGPLDTRNFAHFPEGARALADVGSAADADAGGDGDTHGEADLSEEQLYGSWDRCF